MGDVRVREGFLWLPKVMRNIELDQQEIRWLEKARWYQEYHVVSRMIPGTKTAVSMDDWRNLKWSVHRPINPEFIEE